MNIGAIIPARYDSSRFPGKPLVKISGISMIERVYNQVLKSNKFSEVIVATDSDIIAAEVKRFNGRLEMTSPECSSGTERVWEVLKSSDLNAVINIQGDEPLISENLISDVFNRLKKEKEPVVTAAFFNRSIEDFISDNVVKTVFDQNNKAIYFSRSPIPNTKPSEFKGFFQHIGIYGYTKDALEEFFLMPPTALELKEKLEQLRFIESGMDIYVIKTDYRSFGVDVPDDIQKIEKLLEE